jgi:hypothetical protein
MAVIKRVKKQIHNELMSSFNSFQRMGEEEKKFLLGMV